MGRKSPTKEQARAWLATVIGPMASALETEASRLEPDPPRSYSWRCGRRDFEYLWPTSAMVSRANAPNQLQLFTYFPRLAELAGAHDRALQTLRTSCGEAYDAVLASTPFQQLASEVPSDERKYLAEYLVNGVQELPEDYSQSKHWNVNREQYLRLDDPNLGRRFRSLKRAESESRDAVINLRKEVLRQQMELAEKFGLPPVDPFAAATV